MADSFFGFNTAIPENGLDDAIDCPIDEDELGEEEEYDALNDETFGTDASADDWEQDHEKLAQIAESIRPNNLTTSKPSINNNKNGIDVDIEDSLSHLVLDEKDGIVPKPGVWDSPTNLPQLIPQKPSPLTLPSTSASTPTSTTPLSSLNLKNVCTVEELERGLIRPPPGLVKPAIPTPQIPRNIPGQFILDYAGLNDHLSANLRTNILNNLTPRFPSGLVLPGQHPVILPPNVRLTNPQLLPNSRPIAANQSANLLRYPLPPPPHHLILAHNNQRQPVHGNFIGNFPPRPNITPQFLRPEHPLMPSFSNNHTNHHIQQQHSNQRTERNDMNRNYHSNDSSSSSSSNNHQPFFKSNQHWHQNRNNQRYNQHYHSVNGLNDNGEYDEYAGLMSTREKQWLTNIQLLQHNTNQPYIDDYYFTVFSERKNKNNMHDNNKDRKNKNGYRDSRDKDQQTHVLTKVVYTPTQFENSLGKLQCGSVTAPRKIIDMDVVSNNESQQNATSQQKDLKKARQRLLEIERLYTVQLKLEDLNNPLAQLAEQQQLLLQQQQAEQESATAATAVTEINKPVKKTAPELINIILTSLIQEDKLSSILNIRKGKALLLRFLPFLSVTEYENQLGELWTGIIRGLAMIGRRDAHLLARFFPEFHRWIETISDFTVILRLAKGFMDTANQNNKNNNSLAFASTNKFGVSVIASMLEQAENLYPNDQSLRDQWSIFIINLSNNISTSTPTVGPFHPIPANTLNQHLQRIDGLVIERYALLESLLTDIN